MRILVVALDSPEYRDCLQLRERVLRKPLGLAISENDLALDRESFHIGAAHEGWMVGSVSLKPLSAEVVKLRQMAVDPDLQGQEIGRRLVQFAEQFVSGRGHTKIELNARLTAKGFYDKLGYKTEGEEFVESTVPHIKMVKTLR